MLPAIMNTIDKRMVSWPNASNNRRRDSGVLLVTAPVLTGRLGRLLTFS